MTDQLKAFSSNITALRFAQREPQLVIPMQAATTMEPTHTRPSNRHACFVGEINHHHSEQLAEKTAWPGALRQ